jgi:hypothetical protein
MGGVVQDKEQRGRENGERVRGRTENGRETHHCEIKFEEISLEE